MIIPQFPIREMVPSTARHQYQHSDPRTPKSDLRARIAVQQRRCLDDLPPVLAPFALERLVRLAERLLVEKEQLAERVQREVPLCIFFLVHDRGGQSLLGRLPLEDLLLDGARRDEAVYEA